MGLFDKKFCDICGDKIGLLGNRKLEDGNLCKNCASKLSPWFDERRHSTVDMIKAQLKFREDNQLLANNFKVTRTFGDSYQVLMIDENAGNFAVARMADMPSGNPDIVPCADILDCGLEPKEYKTEIFMKDQEGKNVSYNPKRYEYSYDFYFVIHVNMPYFDEMRFQINKNRVEMREATAAQRVSGVLGVLAGQTNSVSLMNPEYDKYIALGDEMKNTLMLLRGGAGAVEARAQEIAAQAQAVSAAVNQMSSKWTCAACNAENEGGMFCEYCGTKRTL